MSSVPREFAQNIGDIISPGVFSEPNPVKADLLAPTNSLLLGGTARTSTETGRTATVKAGEDIRPALESLKSAGGGTLILLTGVHKINYFIKLSSNISIIGEGSTNTIIDLQNGVENIYAEVKGTVGGGTIAISKGSKTVTGTSTTFTNIVFTKGKTAIFIPSTCEWYFIESINSDTSITLVTEFNGSPISGYTFYYVGDPHNNINFENLTVQNTLATNDIIYIFDATNVTFRNCRFRTAGNDAIDLRRSSNITLDNCRFDDCVNNGGYFSQCGFISIQKTAVVNCTGNGFEFSSCVDISGAFCEFLGMGFLGIEINDCYRFSISDCTMFNNYANITVTGEQINIRNSIFDDCTNSFGLYIDASTVNIIGCTIINSWLDGIYIDSAAYGVVISGCTFGGNGTFSGINIFIDDTALDIIVIGSAVSTDYEGNGMADGMRGNYFSERKVFTGINYRTSTNDIIANSVVVHDAAYYATSFRRTGFEVTTTRGDKYVLGKSENTTVGYTTTMRAQASGRTANLKVSGRDNIAAGDFLTTYIEEGIACKAQPGDMVFAMALENYTSDDSSGVIDTWLFDWRFPMLQLVGVMNVDNTSVGNVGAGEDNLITYSLPPSVLAATSESIRIKAWGTTTNNANTKTLKLYFGSAVILTNALTISVAGKWVIDAVVSRTGTDTQDYFAELRETGTSNSDIENGTATQDDGAAITIKCTGEATSNNDIVQEGLIVELINT